MSTSVSHQSSFSRSEALCSSSVSV